jgi:hypothetical protein
MDAHLEKLVQRLQTTVARHEVALPLVDFVHPEQREGASFDLEALCP